MLKAGVHPTEPGTGSRLRVGQTVRVRPAAEILATLDADGRHGGLPFMPEMLAFAGRELPIFKIAHKTCDMVNKNQTLREFDRTVHLVGARCDGSAHGGCQAGCLLFWREEWLEDNDGVALAATPAPGTPGNDVTVSTLESDTERERLDDGTTLFRCQATELVNASRLLPKRKVQQYLTDIRSGNVGVGTVAFGLLVSAFNKAQSISRALPERLRIKRGAFYPFYGGTGPGPRATPLDLKPGELVEVRSSDEIMPTLGPNNRNRGLWFDQEMLAWCGRRGRVLTKIEKIIDESTGRMLKLRDCVVIQDMNCLGRFHGFCPRSDYTYWREEWLRRVDED